MGGACAGFTLRLILRTGSAGTFSAADDTLRRFRPSIADFVEGLLASTRR
jgi:hypothetical protein